MKGDCCVWLKLFPQTAEENLFYQIRIGRDANTKSSLILHHDNENDTQVFSRHDENSLVNENDYRRFWISWNRGKILVGKGEVVGAEVFLSLNSACPFAIRDIQIRVGPKASGNLDWIIFQGSS